jgi:anti-sigma factor RsiW
MSTSSTDRGADSADRENRGGLIWVRLHTGDIANTRGHDIHLLTGAYAADALTSTELAEFEKHLECCAPCAREARELQGTVARLAMAAALTPPPEMRQQVLADARFIRQLRPPRRRKHTAGARPGAMWRQWVLRPVGGIALAGRRSSR